MQKDMGVTPLALKKRVRLRRDCAGYKQAFLKLSGQRRFNQVGVQPVSIEAIVSYLNGICEFRPIFREEFIDLMCAMDSVFMDYVRKQAEKASKK